MPFFECVDYAYYVVSARTDEGVLGGCLAGFVTQCRHRPTHKIDRDGIHRRRGCTLGFVQLKRHRMAPAGPTPTAETGSKTHRSQGGGPALGAL